MKVYLNGNHELFQKQFRELLLDDDRLATQEAIANYFDAVCSHLDANAPSSVEDIDVQIMTDFHFWEGGAGYRMGIRAGLLATDDPAADWTLISDADDAGRMALAE